MTGCLKGLRRCGEGNNALFLKIASAKTALADLGIGRLAQLVERFLYTEDVGSSSLSSPTIHFGFGCAKIFLKEKHEMNL